MRLPGYHHIREQLQIQHENTAAVSFPSSMLTQWELGNPVSETRTTEQGHLCTSRLTTFGLHFLLVGTPLRGIRKPVLQTEKEGKLHRGCQSTLTIYIHTLIFFKAHFCHFSPAAPYGVNGSVVLDSSPGKKGLTRSPLKLIKSLVKGL